MAIICEKFPKFWVRWEKYIELDLKFAWVRSKIRSELGPQKRKNNPEYYIFQNWSFRECKVPKTETACNNFVKTQFSPCIKAASTGSIIAPI